MEARMPRTKAALMALAEKYNMEFYATTSRTRATGCTACQMSGYRSWTRWRTTVNGAMHGHSIGSTGQARPICTGYFVPKAG